MSQAIAQDHEDVQYAKSLDKYTNAWISMGSLPNMSIWGDTGAADPDDVIQGYIGDCFFVSAISSLVEHDDDLGEEHNTFIERILRMHKKNDEGIYTFSFWALGLPIELSIDDRMPFMTIKPVNASADYVDTDPTYLALEPNDHAMWGPLIEKAYSKLVGNYEAAGSGGWPSESLRAIAGLPGFYVLTSGYY